MDGVHVAFGNLLAVAAVAFAAPLVLGLVPALRVPAVVLEIVAGIAIGPSGLGWVEVDAAVEVLSVVGLAFLLLLAGLEVDVDRLRGRLLELAALGFAVSFALALLVGFAADAGGLADAPLLVAIILSATSLGIVVPVLKDAGEVGTELGQLVIAGSTIADVLTVLLLSLLFSAEASGTGTRALLLVFFAVAAVAVGVVVAGAERSMHLSSALAALQDTTAQIRVRGAFLLLAVFAVLAERLGLETILGAFVAGVVLKVVDRDVMETHPHLRLKLEAAGFGVFVPFFFVASGLRFDLDALLDSRSALAAVPVFAAALLLVRGAPALVYLPRLGRTRAAAAGLLQATSLGFIVVAAQLGMELRLIEPATGAALVAAGLVSVLLYPLGALVLLGRRAEHY